MTTIQKNRNGDTRTASKYVTYEAFQKANDMHRADVSSVMYELSQMIDKAGKFHDCTKKSQERMFWRDFRDTLDNGSDFVNGEWYQLHVMAERHHLLSHCPDDVNLLDVLEMIVDCVCAGKARSGEVRELEISTDILEKALKNTVNLVDSMTEIEPTLGWKIQGSGG